MLFHYCNISKPLLKSTDYYEREVQINWNSAYDICIYAKKCECNMLRYVDRLKRTKKSDAHTQSLLLVAARFFLDLFHFCPFARKPKSRIKRGSTKWCDVMWCSYCVWITKKCVWPCAFFPSNLLNFFSEFEDLTEKISNSEFLYVFDYSCINHAADDSIAFIIEWKFG